MVKSVYLLQPSLQDKMSATFLQTTDLAGICQMGDRNSSLRCSISKCDTAGYSRARDISSHVETNTRYFSQEVGTYWATLVPNFHRKLGFLQSH